MNVIRKETLAGAVIVFAALWLVAAVLYFLLTHPRSLQTEAVQSQLNDKQAELDSLFGEALQKTAAQAKNCRLMMSEYVLLADQQGDLPVRLRKLSSENRLTEFTNKDLSSVGQYQADESANLAERRMRISFVGDFSGFAGFLYSIEKNFPVVFVDTFNVTHNSIDNLKVSVSMESAVLYEVKDKRRM
jgi:hypothetical protein